jgi:hypothetical protein
MGADIAAQRSLTPSSSPALAWGNAFIARSRCRVMISRRPIPKIAAKSKTIAPRSGSDVADNGVEVDSLIKASQIFIAAI